MPETITPEAIATAVGVGFFGPVLLYLVGLLIKAAKDAAQF